MRCWPRTEPERFGGCANVCSALLRSELVLDWLRKVEVELFNARRLTEDEATQAPRSFLMATMILMRSPTEPIPISLRAF